MGGDRVPRWLRFVRDSVLGDTASQIVMGSLTVLLGVLVPIAKAMWGLSPWLSAVAALATLGLIAGLLMFWRGRGELDLVRESARRNRSIEARLAALVRATAHLLAHPPSAATHGQSGTDNWVSSFHQAALEAHALAGVRNSPLPKDIAALLLNPSDHPDLPAKLHTKESDSIYQVRIIHNGAKEALAAFRSRFATPSAGP